MCIQSNIDRKILTCSSLHNRWDEKVHVVYREKVGVNIVRTFFFVRKSRFDKDISKSTKFFAGGECIENESFFLSFSQHFERMEKEKQNLDIDKYQLSARREK